MAPKAGLDLGAGDAERSAFPMIPSRFRFALLFVACATLLRGADAAGPKLGLQSWTCRNMTFEQVVEFAAAHHLNDIEFIAPAHLNHEAPAEESL